MDFIKGAMIGMVAGAAIGVMNSDSILSTLLQGKREIKKMARKCGM